jgi:hypothetical protein
MKMLRSFKCLDNHITERLIKGNEGTIVCKECDQVAYRMLSAPRSFGNTTGRSPSATYNPK